MAKKKPVFTYRMTKPAMGSGRRRIVKYGVTENPERRENQNKNAGLGDKLVKIRRHATREDAEAHERRLIQGYKQRNNNRRPPGNKRG